MIPSKFVGPSNVPTRWIGSNVDMNALEAHRVRDPESIKNGCYVNGAFVNKLIFDNGATWNCITGWEPV